jgi:hypothetical protein
MTFGNYIGGQRIIDGSIEAWPGTAVHPMRIGAPFSAAYLGK